MILLALFLAAFFLGLLRWSWVRATAEIAEVRRIHHLDE